jgi:DegV family protein with EDD domain
MSNIRIVTDSTADLPAEVYQQYGIEIVSLKVHFGDEVYEDKDMDPDFFYQKLVQSVKLPTTSQPSPVDFLEVYKRLNETPGTSIISIHLSSAMSGTYQSAMLAKSMLEEKADIAIIDGKSASYGTGMLVKAAAMAAASGKSKDEIVEFVTKLRQETKLYFLVDTLEYLHKGGRIAKASAVFGSLLNIKPILGIDDDGEVYAVDRVRGQKRAMNRIVELLKQHYGDKEVNVNIAYADKKEICDELGELVKQGLNVKTYSISRIGSVIGTHAGTGATGVFVSPVLDI